MRKKIISYILILCMAAGTLISCGKKEVEKPRLPEYGKDEEYTKEVDDYMASADATVQTPYGDIALLDLTTTTSEYDPAHDSNPKTLVEALYLRDVLTENKRNTQPKFITHFSYSAGTADTELMAKAFVLQSADVPQSIFMDQDSKLYKYYKARQSGAFTVPYLDKAEADGTIYTVTENDKEFTDVYVFPYNGGYIYMETYSPEKRDESSFFTKITEKAKKAIGEGDWEETKKIKKLVEKNRKAILTDEDKASIEDCKQRSSEIIKNMYLTKHDKDVKDADKDQGKTADTDDILSYIPLYKPESTLEFPLYDNVNYDLYYLGYNAKERGKREKKNKITYYYEFSNRYEKADSARFIAYATNKYAKKQYKVFTKKNPAFGSQTVVGKNFKVFYSVNKKDGLMKAVYLFPTKEENISCYDFDYAKNEEYTIDMNQYMPRIVIFKGKIADVIKCMNKIRFTAESYGNDDD